ncbi:MAG: SH3 domain-containing protein [Antarcticimicrobium sp.]|uniref:SH3 domain-containing protein n=1 Tax=Antarcticimicrobium sp. TaxID=2824147 RepID=UPI002615AA42|nr:SH3 domain-containing protein [Antarcticimicrobium sp.]MDF1715728.1 SH3 domain-containing protein [Antarcticimicrobium sp.]
MLRPLLAPMTLALGLAFGLSFGPSGAAQADTLRFVKPGVTLNARSGPGTQYGAKTKLAPGSKVTVLKHQGDWSQVRTPEGLLLWVFGSYLIDQATQPTAPAPQGGPKKAPQAAPQHAPQPKAQPQPQKPPQHHTTQPQPKKAGRAQQPPKQAAKQAPGKAQKQDQPQQRKDPNHKEIPGN